MSRRRGGGRGRRGVGHDNNGWSEYGGYMEAKRVKLAAQFDIEDDADSDSSSSGGGGSNSNSNADSKSTAETLSTIFSNVCIYVDGYTEPPAHELKRLMRRHSGRYAHYYSRAEVTHTVAAQLASSKLNALKAGRVVVRPAWIVDSLAAGRKLSEEPYRLLPGQASLKQWGGFGGRVRVEVFQSLEESTVAL